MTFNKKVITLYLHSNYNVITSKFKTHHLNVITKCLLSNYIVITSLLINTSAKALEFLTPIEAGSLVIGRLQKEETLFLEDTEIKSDSNGFFLFGLHRQSPKEVSLHLKTPTGSQDLILSVKPRKWAAEHVKGLPQHKVVLSSENQERVNQERALIQNARKITTYDSIKTAFTPPVPSMTRLSSPFGSQRVLNNTVLSSHSGTDYAAPLNAEVLAVADGVVRFTHPDMFYSGKTVVIDHGFGLFSGYSHLNTFFVQENQSVKKGEVIGSIGMTGRSSGPHLHFTMTWFHVFVDPERVFQLDFSALKSTD